MIGQLTADQSPAATGGPVLSISADDLSVPQGCRPPTAANCMGSPNLLVASDGLWRSTTRPVPTRHCGTGCCSSVPDHDRRTRCRGVEPLVSTAARAPAVIMEVPSSSGCFRRHSRPSASSPRVEHHHGLFVNRDAEVGNRVLLWFGEVPNFDEVVVRAEQLEAPIMRAPHRNRLKARATVQDIAKSDQGPHGYTVVVASPDGEAYELPEIHLASRTSTTVGDSGFGREADFES